jgi:adenylylsulfate kinase
VDPHIQSLQSTLASGMLLGVTEVGVITGPVGVGKSTVVQEANSLLIGTGVSHATVELEDIARFWGGKPSKSGNAAIAYRNLASVWANYQEAGADRLLLSLLMERKSDLQGVYEAIPAAEIKVVRLSAPLALIEERLRLREKTIPDEEVSAARWWVSRLEDSEFADYVVSNDHRPPRAVAMEVLQLLRWL